MPRQRESNLELLLKAPWWTSVALGVISIAALRWGIPAWAGNSNARQMIAKGISPLAPLPLLFFSLTAIGSLLFAKKRRRLVDEQTSLEQLRNTGWKDFEYLVAEAFRRQGYKVDFSLGRGPDGGVDLTLRRDGRTSLVQCKQWKAFSIGAPVIREMFGLLHDQNADEVIIVTPGKFTCEAQDFAAGKPIQLIDGPQLLRLIQSVQSRPAAIAPNLLRSPEREEVPGGWRRDNGGKPNPTGRPVDARDEMSSSQPLACPKCSQPMILRTSRRGASAGNQFWGCSTYPTCKGTWKL